MVDLWFAGAVRAEPSRAGGALYADGPQGLFAVHVRSPVFAEFDEESANLLSHYGGNVEAVGYLLTVAQVRLPPSLELWSTARAVPAADIGAGMPALISIDGAAQLALSWDFESVRAFATTYRGLHVTVIAPASLGRIELRHTQAPTAPSEAAAAT